ncbi:MAG TPA: heavy metal-binding domain-containing protein [Myxococcales bacterium]
MRVFMAALAVAASSLHAQQRTWTCAMHPQVHEHAPGSCPICGMPLLEEDVPGPRVPHQRTGSGTAWQPDATPARMAHAQLGSWTVMVHGAASLGWDGQAGRRGGSRAVSTNWLMAMGEHPLLGGDLSLRSMVSLEPATIPGAGFPELLQTGEVFDGVHLHDTQHPHDLFMELAVDYRRPLSSWVGFELYGGPVGEPALGPVAFMHRASAQDDPFPPIGHHWQDSTHVTFGVVTAGLYTSELKLEASWFNGREPDQDRWNFDLRPFDSFSVRLSAVPEEHVAVQVSYGNLASPEPPPLQGAVLGVSRVTASVQVSAAGVDATAVWGRNLEFTPLDSVLLEGRYSLTPRDSLFARLERVDKTAHDLVVAGVPIVTAFTVHEAALGASHRFAPLGPVWVGVGARGALAFVPAALESLYGGSVQPGGYVYLLAGLTEARAHAH